MSKPAGQSGGWLGRLQGLGILAGFLGAALSIFGAQYPLFRLSFPMGLCLLLLGWFTLSRASSRQ